MLGDLAGVALSSYILVEAARLGASRAVLARMALNIAVEGIAGLVPFLGDAFDAAFKANQRNVRLLEAWLARPHATARASLGLLVGLALAPVAVVMLVVALLAFLIGS